MSPLQTGTLISGVILVATKAVGTLMEIAAGRELVPSNIGVLITIGATISWVGFFSALNCERLMRRIDQMETRLRSDIPGYGEMCADDARIDIAREHARTNGTPVLATQRGRFRTVD